MLDVHDGWAYVRPPWIAEFVAPGLGWHVVDQDGTEAIIDDDWFTHDKARAEARAVELNQRPSEQTRVDDRGIMKGPTKRGRTADTAGPTAQEGGS